MKKQDLTIGIPKELQDNFRCVSVVPDTVKLLVKKGHTVLIEKDAGIQSFYGNEHYVEAGAQIIEDAESVFGESDVIIKIRPPLINTKLDKYELDLMKEGATIMGFLSPTLDQRVIRTLTTGKLSGFAMELIPRISRSQNMDALSSMSTIMGYRSVLLAANLLGKFFPLLMTAAGTIRPANVLVIGAGVAGLQAIAMAHRIGATVEAFDTRPAVKEQVESLGARFIEMETIEDVETKYGYAKEASDEFIKKEMEAIASRLAKIDVVISTALVFGRKAPLLITEEMVKMMTPGSVIIDLAAEQGGNCELTRAAETIEKHGVIINGAVDLPSQLSFHASMMYSKNVLNAFQNLYRGEDDTIDLEDEINANALVTCKGEIVSEMIKNFMNNGGDNK